MAKLSHKAGMAPGTVVYVGPERTGAARLSVLDFTESDLDSHSPADINSAGKFRESRKMTWLRYGGIHDTGSVQKLAGQYNIHPLTIEDIVNTRLRPKFEVTTDYLFMAVKNLQYDSDEDQLIIEQLSVAWTDSWIISFEEDSGKVLESVRDRVEKTVPRVRAVKPGYMAYALVDAVVDHYFFVLEEINDRIETIEDGLIYDPAPERLEDINSVKRTLAHMRRMVWPLREAVSAFQRTDSNFIDPTIQMYLRDLYDHIMQIIDTIESYRDAINGLVDTYMTAVSNKMNSVMKVLTIIATIFIPLGFLAGVYGMNFNTEISPFNMPELNLPYGYLMFWGFVVLIGGGLLIVFRRLRWW